MAPVGGIFNLAVALRDGIFTNLTREKFNECFAPKAFATKFLDELSREKCPSLEHFVVFSSVSCGRGNAGQTNYGMANSIMERIIEDRIANGYPAKAIQWGAVGEVGLVADLAEDKIDMEIGGTLQQRISSCLQELDRLLTSSEAIVSSMVVAEKRVGRSGNENIVETVMNIMGIRDLKSVSLGTPLSEMGMDSLMTVEIKQTLERDFELLISPQDLRLLTFQKLQEFANKREHETKDIVEMLFSSKKEGMELLLRNLGNESGCNDVFVQLNTSTNYSTKSIPLIIIPGLEGTAGKVWFKIAAEISSKATLLQLHSFSKLNTIQEIAETSFEHVKSVLSVTEPFYIVGYSFGSYVAIQLVDMLEKAGYRGQLLLIDGAPHFLTKFTLLQLGNNFVDNDIYDLLITTTINIIFPEETKESTGLIFKNIASLEGKLDRFIEYVTKQTIYSKEYCLELVDGMFRRIRMVALYDLDNIKKIKTSITLIRPDLVTLQDIEEDYCLSRFKTGKVITKVIEGNHTTILDNPLLPQLINDFDPALKNGKPENIV